MRRVAIALVLAATSSTTACAPGGLQDSTLVNSVRILSSMADLPYAPPGATVNLQVLAVDGRAIQPEPMVVTFIPLLCEDPADDAYYNCFQQLAVGLGSGGGLDIPTGVDLTPYLSVGTTYQLTMPLDVVTKHAITPTPPIPYGLEIVFNVACAGHLERVPLDPNNVQAPPIGCFDAQHNQLGPTDYVFGFTRVYSYTTDSQVTNANPVIDHIDLDGQPLNLQTGLDISPCTGSGPPCKIPIGPVVPPSSQESTGLQEQGLKEQIWADFYSTIGSFGSDARLLYDPVAGSVGTTSETDNQFNPPATPGNGTMWIVVHDNRGGAAWVTFPVLVH